MNTWKYPNLQVISLIIDKMGLNTNASHTFLIFIFKNYWDNFGSWALFTALCWSMGQTPNRKTLKFVAETQENLKKLKVCEYFALFKTKWTPSHKQKKKCTS